MHYSEVNHTIFHGNVSQIGLEPELVSLKGAARKTSFSTRKGGEVQFRLCLKANYPMHIIPQADVRRNEEALVQQN